MRGSVSLVVRVSRPFPLVEVRLKEENKEKMMGNEEKYEFEASPLI